VIYLDWNATTPPAEEVTRRMADALGRIWGNPSSVHGAGRSARAEVEDARAAIGDALGLDARDVLLTGGATESNNIALRSLVGGGGTLVTSRIEHPSVTRVAEALESEGVAVLWLAPSDAGVIDPASVEVALRERRAGPACVTVTAVNHETGVLQPVAALAEIAHRHGALLHVDAAQAFGKIEPEAFAGGDLVSIAAHKIRGPKGVGALATRPGIKLRPVLRGGAQEKGIRPGTVDPIAAIGFGAAVTRARSGPERYRPIAALRDSLEARLVAAGARVNGAGLRAPHVTNLSFDGWRGPELAAALDLEGVCVSSGSACSAGTAEPSAVITAMLGIGRAASALRISLGDASTEAETDAAMAAFERVLARGR
jgi:cysteine desulfurase